MGYLKDVIDTINDISSVSGTGSDIANSIMYDDTRGSISQRAKSGILQFPVLISRNNMDLETAMMVCKALERNYATFVQIVVSMNSVVKISDVQTPEEFIRLFHTNNSSLLESVSSDPMRLGNVIHDIGNARVVSTVYTNAGTDGLTSINKESFISSMVDMRKTTLNNILTKRDTSGPLFAFSDPEKNKKFNNVVYEFKRDSMSGNTMADAFASAGVTVDSETANNEISDEETRRILDDFNRQDRDEARRRERASNPKSSSSPKSSVSVNTPPPIDNDSSKPEKTTKNDKGSKDKTGKDKPGVTKYNNTVTYNIKQGSSKSNNDIEEKSKYNVHGRIAPTLSANNMLKDNDVRKSNELVSTTLHIVIKQLSDDNLYAGMVDFIIGVKGVLHPVDSDDVVVQLRKANERKGIFFNILRWTTGELSFVKDLLLSVDDAKFDNLELSNGSGAYNWFRRLKEMKRRRNITTALRRIGVTKNTILPNANLVITQEEVDFLRINYSIDMTDIRTVKTVLEDLFLLGFTIVDSASKAVSFIFSGDEDFQVVSFSGLEKEDANEQRKFKEMLKVINRI